MIDGLAFNLSLSILAHPFVVDDQEPLESQKITDDQMDGVKSCDQTKALLGQRVVQSELPTDPVVSVDIEAVCSKTKQVIA